MFKSRSKNILHAPHSTLNVKDLSLLPLREQERPLNGMFNPTAMESGEMTSKGLPVNLLTTLASELKKLGLEFDDHQVHRLASTAIDVLISQEVEKDDRRDYVIENLSSLIAQWRTATGKVSIQVSYAINSRLNGVERIAFIEKLLKNDGVVINHSLDDIDETHIRQTKTDHIEHIVLSFPYEPTMDLVRLEVLEVIKNQEESVK